MLFAVFLLLRAEVIFQAECVPNAGVAAAIAQPAVTDHGTP